MALRAACERVISVADLVECDCDIDKIVPPLSSDDINDVLDAACDALARITQLPVGRCVTVYRPCAEWCHYWECACGCNPVGIPLPGFYPIVNAVTIDGVELDESEYVVVEGPAGTTVERIGTSWPIGQSVSATLGGVGTFGISVESGLYPDATIRAAAAEIACEMFSRLADNGREPVEGAVTMSGYGTTVSTIRFGTPTQQDAINLMGLGWVRRFVASAGGLSAAAIVSPDMQRGWTLYQTR